MPPADPQPTNLLRGAHVLVVDDEPVSAEQTARVLRDLGHKATLCHSWVDAVRIFGQGGVDLVLMDAVMPTVDGFKLTKILRARATSYVPIVFLTGLSDHRARAHGIAVGADDFLVKPLDPLELKVRLIAMLRIRSLTRDLEAKTRALSRLASMDALTGVANRRSFDARIRQEVARSQQPEGLPLTVLILDIDHFKLVNDNHGHTVGDEMLSVFGRLLSELTRACDLPFRYGGEEFAVLATETSSAQAQGLAERIRSAFNLRTQEMSVCGAQSVSIGLCGTDQLHPGYQSTDLVVAADVALYRAKAAGRNRVCKFDTRLDARAA